MGAEQRRSRVGSEWERIWSIEIERRMADVVMDRVELVAADDVHEELRTQLRNRRR
jgi:hypothetical protein